MALCGISRSMLDQTHWHWDDVGSVTLALLHHVGPMALALDVCLDALCLCLGNLPPSPHLHNFAITFESVES